MSGFIGIHIGAGNHSEKNRNAYKNLCSKACKKGMEKLKNGANANEVVAEVIAFLEDSQLTNAGFGSNLNWDGEVECDASIMDGSTLCYGAIGSVNGVKNPIKLAYAVSQKSQENLALGRIPPSFLVGNGAKDFAKSYDIEIIEPQNLISDKAKKNYHMYKRRLEKYRKYQKMGTLDTVGAVCVDSERNVSAGCSSGGIALKHSGRVGQAGVFGCGCWADSSAGIASSTSGVGEYLIKTNLAKTLAQDIQNSTVFPAEALQHSMTNNFLNSPFLANCEYNNKQAGAILLKYNPKEDFGEFLWAHSTLSMSIAYMSSQDDHPHFSLSRLPFGTEAGTSVVIEGILYKY